MSQYQQLHVDRDERGVVTVTFDAAGRPVNVFGEHLLQELQEVVQELETSENLRLVVFRSAKPAGFLAGADVFRIREITDADEATTVLKLGQDLFSRIESLPVPTVAVIHGTCLGGGLEFALSCRYRIALDDPSTRMGLPETQLGLIPGWGGTQRLPRTIGLAAGLKMILTGATKSTASARKLGLIDETASADAFDADIAKFVDDCLNGSFPPRKKKTWFSRLRDDTRLGRKTVLKFARRQLGDRAKHYPALPAALDAIETGLRDGMKIGLTEERKQFCRVLFTPACRNLIDLFCRRELARKRSAWVADDVDSGSPIETVAVLGAGVMGAGIAQLAATQGCAVILKDIDEETVQRGMERIESLTEHGVRKGALKSSAAERALSSITATAEMKPVERADLVVEAVVERLDVKQKIFRQLDEQMPADALLASNTSALPISEMADVTKRADRVAGLHFFNPVHKMPLVEIVRCPQTSDRTIAVLVDFVRRLGKTPIVVAEGPGFLVNRVLFPYLDEAVRMVAEGVAVEQIDREAKGFGMPMGPLELLDTVGLDVAFDVSHSLSPLAHDETPTPKWLEEMVAAGHKGQKSGQGFYHYKGSRRRHPAVEANQSTTAATPPPREFAGETLSGVQQRLVFSMINSAAECLHDHIVSEPWMADLGMVLGTGFAPFRGGPMRLIEHWGRERVVETLLHLSEVCGPRFRPSDYFTSAAAADDRPAAEQPLGTTQA